VTISLLVDDKEDEDGRDGISIQESSECIPRMRDDGIEGLSAPKGWRLSGSSLCRAEGSLYAGCIVCVPLFAFCVMMMSPP